MATFTLNVDTVETVFDKNDDETGFEIVTTAVPGQRHYRISRERTNLTTVIDYFDFYLDLTGVASGTDVTRSIPYIPSLFSVSPTPIDFSQIPTDTPGSPITGETFKLLYMTPTVEDDPVRETPSYINTKRIYTMSGVPRPIAYIYYILVDGQPKYASPHGNVAFDDQYNHNIPIDPTKRLDVVTDGEIDYHIIRVSTTPGLVVGKGAAKLTTALSDTYSDSLYRYSLKASSHSTQPWIGESGKKPNGFYVVLKVLGSADEDNPVLEPQPDPRFYATPRVSIESAELTHLGGLEFQFLIRPKIGITSMDLRITVTGNPQDYLIGGSGVG